MRWTLMARQANALDADGEVVWFWRSEAGAKVAKMLTRLAGDGGNQAMVTEESTYKLLKPSRGECRAFSGVTVVTNARAYYTTRAAAGASSARHSLRPHL